MSYYEMGKNRLKSIFGDQLLNELICIGLIVDQDIIRFEQIDIPSGAVDPNSLSDMSIPELISEVSGEVVRLNGETLIRQDGTKFVITSKSSRSRKAV